MSSHSSTWHRGAVVACSLVLGLSALAGAASAAKDDVDLVSRASGPTGAKGKDDSISPAISADGRFVAFDSIASNLDGDATDDVFVRDLQTNTTTLVSRADGAAGAKGNATSADAAISADGRFVAFDSAASNLDPADGDTSGNVFVRDLQTNTTTLVSRASSAAGTKGDRPSSSPAISADGRFVAFSSAASNLDPADGDTSGNVFVRNLQTNTTTLVSRASGAGGAVGNAGSGDVAISATGRFVAFDSSATNLDPADSDNDTDIFVRDLQTNTTTLVSRAGGVAGAPGNGFSAAPTISADGRFVAFDSFASNLDPADGDATADVFVRDLQAKTTTLVSGAAGPSGAKGDDFSTDAAISADGRFVAFDSAASNLQPVDADSIGNVFVRDLQTGTTTLVSRAVGATGVPANGLSVFPAITRDGRFVVFYSFASNLSPTDGDTSADVFRRDVLGPPVVQPSRISINDVTVAEGNSGQTSFRFTVSLDRAQPAPVTIGFSTANATAAAPGDYVARGGTITFAPGRTSEPVTVQVNGDTTVEPNETFAVNLANAAGNATIADAHAIGTIANDDQSATEPRSRISIADARRREGNHGRTAFRFTISLDRAQSAPVSVSFSTANGTARAPRDYSPAGGTVTFARGETAKTITVFVRGERLKEPNEACRVNLAASAGNAAIADAHARGTIVNDDRRRHSVPRVEMRVP